MEQKIRSILNGAADISEDTHERIYNSLIELTRFIDLSGNIYENLPLSYQSLDENGRFLAVNKNWLEYLGYKRGEVIGRNFSDFIASEYKTSFQKHFSYLKLNGKIMNCEFQMIRKDGTKMYVSYNGRIECDKNKKFIRTHCIFHDISKTNVAKKQSENEKYNLLRAERDLRENKNIYKELVDSSPVSLIITDFKGKIYYCNRVTEVLLNLKKEEIIGKTLDYFKNFDDSERKQLKNLSEELYKKGTTFRFEFDFTDYLGEAIYFESVIAALDLEDNRYMQIISQDITKRKIMEIKLESTKNILNELNEELRFSNRELEAFIDSASHDLRAPLRRIESFSKVLLDDYSDQISGKGRKILRRIVNGTEQMKEMLISLLNLSHINKNKVKRELINLSHLVNMIMSILHDLDPDRSVTVHIQKDVFTNGDKHLLHILLRNLLENSWKFTKTSINAVIEFGMEISGNKKIYFVKDNGIGFNMNEADKLFQVFRRLHSTNDYKGFGIGLATAKRIIKRHGGKIWAESEKNVGTTIYFTL
jgi:PAS domain S-box-containing protein